MKTTTINSISLDKIYNAQQNIKVVIEQTPLVLMKNWYNSGGEKSS